MLLVDQVELLRVNLEQLRNQRVALPLMGGLSATRQTYHFKSLMLPARDIATTVVNADPSGNKLPTRLRGWNIDTKDGYNNPQVITLKKLLGMIIHVYYLHLEDNVLDISNDGGTRVIIPYDAFLDSVERLVLTPQEICLVICGLTEEKLKKQRKSVALAEMIPGPGDLLHFLATIREWPELHESIWSTLFADRTTTVEEDCQTINDSPFLMSGHHNGTTALWRIGWRREDAYAVSLIDVSQLVKRIQDYFFKH